MSKIETAKKVGEFMIHFAKKNLPSIMSVCGGIGVVVTTGLAIKETPKAMEKIEAKKVKDPDISALEMVAVAVPEYAPALIAFAITEGLIFGANHINLKRIAALGALYTGVCADNKTKDKAIKALEEIVGKEKVDELKKKLDISEPEVANSIGQDAYTVEKCISQGKNEKRPCVLGYTGSEFRATYNELKAGIQKCKEYFSPIGDAMYISLGDVLYNLHAPACDAGDQLGFGEDFDADVVECNFNGTLGWKVIFYTQPTDDYDQLG